MDGSEGPFAAPVPLVALGVVLAGLLMAAVAFSAEPFLPDAYGPGQDARAYWAAPAGDPYDVGSVGRESAYLYSPAFLQVLAPLRELPWPPFLLAWTGLLLVALVLLSGPILFVPVLALALHEVWGGNIHLVLALAIVVGFRWPAAWAFVLLTKVTPGIGLVWFAVRREWRSLGAALGATVLVVIGSALLAPQLWQDWLALLRSSAGSSTVPGSVPIPLLWRLPVALAVIVWAARTDRRWLLPIGAMLALPVIWWGGLTMILGSVALQRPRLEAWFLERIGDRPRDGRPAAERAPT